MFKTRTEKVLGSTLAALALFAGLVAADYRITTGAGTNGIGTPILGIMKLLGQDMSGGTDGNWTTATFDSAGSLRVTEEGSKPTYFATSQFASDSTATDIWAFPGVAGKTAKIQWISVTTTATAAATGDMTLVRRSAADTAGTSANASIAQADTRDAAASCQPIHYTAHPTALGATAGTMFATRFVQPAASTLSPYPGYFFDLRNYNGGRGIRVQGTTDFIYLNVPAALGGAGNAYDITVCWTEENSSS